MQIEFKRKMKALLFTENEGKKCIKSECMLQDICDNVFKAKWFLLECSRESRSEKKVVKLGRERRLNEKLILYDFGKEKFPFSSPLR